MAVFQQLKHGISCRHPLSVHEAGLKDITIFRFALKLTCNTSKRLPAKLLDSLQVYFVDFLVFVLTCGYGIPVKITLLSFYMSCLTDNQIPLLQELHM